jgi:hypothetical protein
MTYKNSFLTSITSEDKQALDLNSQVVAHMSSPATTPDFRAYTTTLRHLSMVQEASSCIQCGQAGCDMYRGSRSPDFVDEGIMTEEHEDTINKQ